MALGPPRRSRPLSTVPQRFAAFQTRRRYRAGPSRRYRPSRPGRGWPGGWSPPCSARSRWTRRIPRSRRTLIAGCFARAASSPVRRCLRFGALRLPITTATLPLVTDRPGPGASPARARPPPRCRCRCKPCTWLPGTGPSHANHRDTGRAGRREITSHHAAGIHWGTTAIPERLLRQRGLEDGDLGSGRRPGVARGTRLVRPELLRLGLHALAGVRPVRVVQGLRQGRCTSRRRLAWPCVAVSGAQTAQGQCGGRRVAASRTPVFHGSRMSSSVASH